MSARWVVWGMLVVIGGCRRPPAVSAEADAGAVASSKEEAPPVAPPSEEPSPKEAAPSGPAVGELPPDERKRVLASLLSGTYRTSDLAEAATDPGRSFDRGLRKRLTEVEVPPGPRADVQMEAAKATVPIADLDRVIAGMRPRFRLCHQVALDAGSTATGKAVVTFVVDDKGEVTSSTPVPSGGLPETTATCAANVVRRAQFAAPQKASTVTLQLTFAVAK